MSLLSYFQHCKFSNTSVFLTNVSLHMENTYTTRARAQVVIQLYFVFCVYIRFKINEPQCELCEQHSVRGPQTRDYNSVKPCDVGDYLFKVVFMFCLSVYRFSPIFETHIMLAKRVNKSILTYMAPALWTLLLICHKSVSYTHLDVYKRQILH